MTGPSPSSGAGRRVIAYADGAARGNPGPAAYGGVVLTADGTPLREISAAIGRATNNEAEYRGAIAVVEAALAAGARELDLRMDSELIVRQLQGQYRVRSPHLQPLYRQLTALIERLERFSVRHVPREANQRADALANAALDRIS